MKPYFFPCYCHKSLMLRILYLGSSILISLPNWINEAHFMFLNLLPCDAFIRVYVDRSKHPTCLKVFSMRVTTQHTEANVREYSWHENLGRGISFKFIIAEDRCFDTKMGVNFFILISVRDSMYSTSYRLGQKKFKYFLNKGFWKPDSWIVYTFSSY